MSDGNITFCQIFSRIISLRNGETIYEFDDNSDTLGEGKFGTVYKGIRKIGNSTEDVAFKVNKNWGQWEEIKKEKDIYERIGVHDSIPELYKYFPESIDTNAMLVTELFGTNLLTLRNNFKPLSTPTIMRIGLQILDVIEHMHENGVVHCDAHIGNLAAGLNNETRIYIFDFGWSEIIHDDKFVKSGMDMRRLDTRALGRNLIKLLYPDYLSFFKIETDNDIDCKETLNLFLEKAVNPESEKPDYEKLREILQTELKKHTNHPNYEEFEWQL